VVVIALTIHLLTKKGRSLSHHQNTHQAAWPPLLAWFSSSASRPFRFIVVGVLTALLQIGILYWLLQYHWNATIANVIAFLLSAQANFLLNSLFTWQDRQEPGKRESLLKRWIAFHGSIAGTGLLNNLVFLGAHIVMPTLVASLLGTGAAALVNFTIMNFFVFRTRPAFAGVETSQTSRTEPELSLLGGKPLASADEQRPGGHLHQKTGVLL
jgi:putative flippase GtrA